MLIHDDVIDRDLMRHGEKNLSGSCMYRQDFDNEKIAEYKTAKYSFVNTLKIGLICANREDYNLCKNL